jgi:hypothetical protein
MMQVTLPGERWEIEFFDDREPEVEIFRSNGDMFGPEKLTELRYGEALGSAFDPFQKFGLRPAPEIWFCVQSERAGPPWPALSSPA